MTKRRYEISLLVGPCLGTDVETLLDELIEHYENIGCPLNGVFALFERDERSGE